MSRKHKQGLRLDSAKLRERAERELARGNSRQALKDTRLCFRTEASDEHRQLLARAELARTTDLQKAGLYDQAREHLGALMQLGVMLPEIQQQIPRLQVLLGVTGSSQATHPAALLEANAELLLLVADQVVLHPDRATTATEAVRRDAQAVRAALEALERGDESGAAERLIGINRQSPLADWKLFARGLSAHYVGDRDRRQANWDRLDPQRAAHRIARTLLAFNGETSGEVPAEIASGVRRLAYALQSGGISEQLNVLGEHVRGERWSEALQAFRTFRQRYSQSHAPLVDRTVELLWKPLVRDGDARGVEQLARIAPAPELDPHWHRARALLAEHQKRASLNAVEEAWERYVRTLPQVAALREDERPVAAGLVYLRLARLFAEHARDLGPGARAMFPWSRPDARYVKTVREQAVKYLRQSVQHCPRLVAAYRELADLHRELGDGKAVAKDYQQLLREFPDDYDARVALAQLYLDDDDPAAAAPHVEAAGRLKLREPESVALAWNLRLATIRHATRKRQFTVAREALAAATANRPPTAEPYWLDTLRAAVEYKAGNHEAAQQHLQTALAYFQEPTAVWLMMSYCAARCGLAKQLKKQFDTQFKAAVTQTPPSSQTAGRMAQFLAPMISRKTKQTEYVGRATHQRLVGGYLQRCEKVAWTAEDLRNVCYFLSHQTGWKERDLFARLARAGEKRLPDDPTLAFWRGEAEMRAGPFSVSTQAATAAFQRALDLNKTASVPLPASYVARAKHALALLAESARLSARMLESLDDEPDDDDEDDFASEHDGEGMDDDSVSPGGLDEETLRASLPPGLFDEMKAQSESLGLDLMGMLGEFLQPRAEADDSDRPPPGGFGHHPHEKRKATRRG